MVDSKGPPGWRARLEKYIRTRGGRVTRTRMQVAEVFFALGGHPAIEQLAAEVHARHPGIGNATIYRTMKLLCDSGLADMHRFGESFTRFEPVEPGGHHDHLICTRCGAIIEFGDETMERLQEAITRRHGFVMESHRLEIFGMCARCAKLEHERNQNSSPSTGTTAK